MNLQLTGHANLMIKFLTLLRIDKNLTYIDAYTKLCSFEGMKLSPWSYTLS